MTAWSFTDIQLVLVPATLSAFGSVKGFRPRTIRVRDESFAELVSFFRLSVSIPLFAFRTLLVLPMRIDTNS